MDFNYKRYYLTGYTDDLYHKVVEEFEEGDTIRLIDCERTGLLLDIIGMDKDNFNKHMEDILDLSYSFCENLENKKIDLTKEKEFSIVFDDFSISLRFCKNHSL